MHLGVLGVIVDPPLTDQYEDSLNYDIDTLFDDHCKGEGLWESLRGLWKHHKKRNEQRHLIPEGGPYPSDRSA